MLMLQYCRTRQKKTDIGSPMHHSIGDMITIAHIHREIERYPWHNSINIMNIMNIINVINIIKII